MCFGGKSPLESSASSQCTFEKVSIEKAHAKYLKMLLGSQTLLRMNAHTQILHRQRLYLAVSPILKLTGVWFGCNLGLQNLRLQTHLRIRPKPS